MTGMVFPQVASANVLPGESFSELPVEDFSVGGARGASLSFYDTGTCEVAHPEIPPGIFFPPPPLCAAPIPNWPQGRVTRLRTMRGQLP